MFLIIYVLIYYTKRLYLKIIELSVRMIWFIDLNLNFILFFKEKKKLKFRFFVVKINRAFVICYCCYFFEMFRSSGKPIRNRIESIIIVFFFVFKKRDTRIGACFLRANCFRRFQQLEISIPNPILNKTKN